MSLESGALEAIPGIEHGFGTAAEPVPARFIGTWKERHPERRQIHGTAIAVATTFGQVCGEVDGLVTRVPGLPISALTADCVPILLARADGSAVAAIHAGWRGTKARILRAFWEVIRSGAPGERPGDWVAAIGPAIGPCCYEVSVELAEEFSRDFVDLLPADRILPRPRMLDLPAVNEAELRSLGLREIEVLRACTKCSVAEDGSSRFHSFRRQGGGHRQWSAIRIAD